MNILVIGGGLSGLAAAWRLRRAGHAVSLIDRRDPADGDFPLAELDSFHSSDRHVVTWISELGLADRLLPLRPLQVAQVLRGRTTAIDPQRLLGIAAIPGIRKRHALRLLRWSRLMSRYLPLLDPTAPERAADLDYRSVSDFAGLYFGESVLKHWVAPEVEDFFSGEASELSRVTALLLWRARMAGSSGYPGLARSGLEAIFGVANRALATRHHGAVLGIEAEGTQGYAVSFEGAGAGATPLRVDAVVVATSAKDAGQLAATQLEPAERDFFAGVRYRPTVTLTADLERAPSGMPERVRLPHGEGFSAESVVFEPGLAGSRVASGAGMAMVRAREAFARTAAQVPDDGVAKGLLADLENLYPALVGSVGAFRLHRSAAGIPAFDVGAYRALARFRRVQEDRRSRGRRLYFAGNYLIAPGVEGQVVAGFRAAADLIADARDAAPGSGS